MGNCRKKHGPGRKLPAWADGFVQDRIYSALGRRARRRHYKGGLYRYIDTARHSETEESMVVYEHLWPHARGLWVRPADLFFGQLADGSARFAPLPAAR